MQKLKLRGPRSRSLVGLWHSIAMQAKFWLLVLGAIAVVAAILFLAVGHSQSQDVLKVNLDQRSWVSPVQQISGDAHTQPSDHSLRVAIAGVLSPGKTLEDYQELLAYMGQKLGREVTLILKPTYAEINDLVRGERADIAFVCSLAYVEGNEGFGMELLVVPQMYGETVYHSYLIVPEESSATTLEDLRGASFAFTDPLSNSGHLAPAYHLSLLGEAPASFFGRYVFTYSHDNSITAVADKLLDGAAVDSLVYDQMVANNPELASKTQVIARWGPYGIPPIVVSPGLDPQLKQELRDFFLDIHTSEAGRSILEKLAIDRFVIVSDELYDSIEEMKTELRW